MRRAFGRIAGAWVLSLAFAALAPALGAEPVEEKLPKAPMAGHRAPDFTLPDLENKNRSLIEFRGRPVALFLFCGCPPCWEVAGEWAQVQRGGALPDSEDPDASAATVLVVGLDVDGTRFMSEDSGLVEERSVFLPDPDLRVTESLYLAHRCPRVFVLNGEGIVEYTNDGEDDAPETAPAALIVSRAVDALRSAVSSPSSSETAESGRR